MNAVSRLHIGMRTVKTAAAAGLAVFIGYLIHSPYPPFLAIGALGAMQTSITESLRSGRDAVIGNLIGILLAVAFYMLFTGHMALASFFGVLLMIILCNFFKIHPAITGLACVVFCCTVVDLGQNNNLLSCVLRFRDIFIGTVVALAVNILIRPYSDVSRLKKKLQTIQLSMLPLLEERVLRGRMPDLTEVRGSVNALDRNIDALLSEKFNRSLKQTEIAHLLGCQQLLWKMRDSLIGICCIDTTPKPSAANLMRIKKLDLSDNRHSAFMLNGKCSEEETAVFNYYLKMFLDSHDYLNELIDL